MAWLYTATASKTRKIQSWSENQLIIATFAWRIVAPSGLTRLERDVAAEPTAWFMLCLGLAPLALQRLELTPL